MVRLERRSCHLVIWSEWVLRIHLHFILGLFLTSTGEKLCKNIYFSGETRRGYLRNKYQSLSSFFEFKITIKKSIFDRAVFFFDLGSPLNIKSFYCNLNNFFAVKLAI